MSSIESYVAKIKKKLSSPEIEEKKILKYLGHLESIEVNVEILKSTGIGKLVNGLKKHEGVVGDVANCLVLKWKTAVTKQQEDCSMLDHNSSAKSSRLSLLNSETSGPNKQTQGKTKERDGNEIRDDKKKEDSKSKGPSLQLCDISFGCETPPSKDINRPKKKHKLTMTSSSTTTTASTGNNNFDYSTAILPPLPTIASVNEALLPDIQPTYRPSRFPMFDDSPLKKKKGADIEGTYVGEIKSKKSKTQVFSGRRNPNSSGVVPTLFDMCIRVLVENIEALHETGGVPYYILHPVLLKCTPQQLLHLEDCNPEIIEESDELWMTHYRREFKTENQMKGLSWRESYLAKSDEREEKLKKINAKITASQAAKRPERQVKLAYLETIAKPPPQIRRKQAKFGTAHGAAGNEVPSNSISPIKNKPSHHKSSNPLRHTSTHSQSSRSSTFSQSNFVPTMPPPDPIAPPRRPTSAPLLKKTMKMFKNQRSINGAQIKRR